MWRCSFLCTKWNYMISRMHYIFIRTIIDIIIMFATFVNLDPTSSSAYSESLSISSDKESLSVTNIISCSCSLVLVPSSTILCPTLTI